MGGTRRHVEARIKCQTAAGLAWIIASFQFWAEEKLIQGMRLIRHM